MQQALTTKIGEGQVNWILIVELQNFQHHEPKKRIILILAVDTLALRRGTPGDVSWGEEETSDS